MVSAQSLTQVSRYSVDKQVQDFLHMHMDSFIKWDLIRFFHDNPHVEDTAANIAHYTGRDILTIERELRGLVRTRVLRSETVSSMVIYRLTDEERILKTMSRFIEACHDRSFRAEVIQHVIRRLKSA